jgi:hypothetical protein
MGDWMPTEGGNTGLVKFNQRPSTYWCHECRKDAIAEHDDDWGPWWYCLDCGTTIKCDSCGQDWTNDHLCSTVDT